MTGFSALAKRNIKLFYKDKGTFFTSLITPMILLVLYGTFLANVYKDSFFAAVPEGIAVEEKLIDALVGGQLLSSLLAVCCVTVAFCSNMIMVTDKVNGAYNDLRVTPVKRSTMAFAYYAATLVNTLFICFVGAGLGLLYVSSLGWYLSVSDVLLIFLDTFLLVMFGVALSSLINYFLSTQGQISAVGSIVSSVYGFICGAYMPISQFGEGLQNVLSFLPGTYATSLLREHSMNGVFEKMTASGVPDEVVNGFRDTVDCNVYFFGESVAEGTKLFILAASTVLLIGAYIAVNMIFSGKKKK